VIAATVAIARLGLPVAVTTWAACAENMPSGTAIRPSDVLTTYGGKTIEVLNTDAEGRLVLADALAAAGEEKPDVMIDVATLTGAQLVALGARTSAIMANDEGLRAAVHRASEYAGEAMWPMPLPTSSARRWTPRSRHRQHGRQVRRHARRRPVPARLRPGRHPVGAPRHRRPVVQPVGPYGYTPKGGTGHRRPHPGPGRRGARGGDPAAGLTDWTVRVTVGARR
jgi:leucyl aminopeptidase